MEGVHGTPGGHGQSHLRVSASRYWAGGEGQPGVGQVPALLLSGSAGGVGRFSTLDGVVQNSLRHSSTNLTPFQSVLGYQPALAPWHPSQIEALVGDQWFQRAEEICNAAYPRLQPSSPVCWHNEQADRHRSEVPVSSPGDRVWLSTRNLLLHLPCRKLTPRFFGRLKPLRARRQYFHFRMKACPK